MILSFFLFKDNARVVFQMGPLAVQMGPLGTRFYVLLPPILGRTRASWQCLLDLSGEIPYSNGGFFGNVRRASSCRS